MGVVFGLSLGLVILLTFVAFSNDLLMIRPRRASTARQFIALIPARNEAGKIGPLVAQLREMRVNVVVYDDDSTDGTGEEAAAAGAQVMRGSGPPEGWTGKNYACYQLSKVAAEVHSGDWWLFLDADVELKSYAAGYLNFLIERQGIRWPVITGFLTTAPGRGLEFWATNWVWEILLATNPFGLVSRTRLGHNRFTNGQIQLWKSSTYLEVNPHESVRSDVLDDVAMGRLLARQRVPVLVADLTAVGTVRMYDTFRQGLDGMSKNGYAIAGRATPLLVLFFVAWALSGFGLATQWRIWGYFAAAFPAAIALGIVKRGMAYALLYPIDLLVGAFTLLRSQLWYRRRSITWKGRTYSG